MTAPDSDASLEGRHILLGVTGGIAAYKSASLLRLFKKSGADVQVAMTPDATRFITPLTLGTLSEHPVLIEIFPEGEEGSWTKHISLGQWADLFVIAPATAQTLAKLAHGFSDSMLTATALAARCPVLLCPAMDHDMLVHPATKRNLEVLRADGYLIMEPAYGSLASGLIGEGRLPEPEDIFARVAEILRTPRPSGAETEEFRGDGERAHFARPPRGDLEGMRVVVTAGPTREHIDPVRFISNPSSGRMGYALAAEAARRGAQVTLVSGPTRLETPGGVDRVDVTTAGEMYDAVMAHRDADLFLMAAAVSDYTPRDTSTRKIKKSDDELTLHLEPTKDILAELGRMKREGQVLVGFAMETDDWIENARRKLTSKNADWIVLNRLNEEGAGFEVETNRVVLLGRDGTEDPLPLMSKTEVAARILDRVSKDARHPA